MDCDTLKFRSSYIKFLNSRKWMNAKTRETLAFFKNISSIPRCSGNKEYYSSNGF